MDVVYVLRFVYITNKIKYGRHFATDWSLFLLTDILLTIQKCPFEAIQIINLPKDLDKDTTHRYGPNTFKLHRCVEAASLLDKSLADQIFDIFIK